jgi:hypothetical protein
MATDENSRKLTLIAAAATPRFRAIVGGTAGEGDIAGAGVPIIGVSTEDGILLGDAMPVQLADGGVAPVEAGAAFADGASLMTNATGQFITATIGNPIVATAQAAAAGALSVVRAIILNQGDSP